MTTSHTTVMLGAAKQLDFRPLRQTILSSEVFMRFALFLFLVLLPTTAPAAITKLVIENREPFAGGHEFGVTGAYEKLIGKAYGELDSKAKANNGIVNLAKAPKNERRRVEYSMDVLILKPVDLKRGNQTI